MHNTAALSEIISCDSDFRIARDGTWYHQGSPIGRQAMVRLFSTILCRDADGSYWLKTPVEKCSIEVEDTPFTIISLFRFDFYLSKSLVFHLIQLIFLCFRFIFLD